ncbi:sensor histidine kinase [Hamadaea tsunoensis]|uniref:sensor histidine kinase n=1 Tax=Hamadaea tsunoensis TaxID=53368 RepID=UPI000418569A|nr:HAMP domain-containing sensor histidine kinase [Hamadaea tsunoensis]
MKSLPSSLRHPIRNKPLRVKLMATVLVLLVAAMSLTGVASVAFLRKILLADTDAALAEQSASVYAQADYAAKHGQTQSGLNLPYSYLCVVEDPDTGNSWQKMSSDFHLTEAQLPNLPSPAEATKNLGEPFTVDSNGDRSRWRVVAVKLPQGLTALVATSQSGVDEAVQKLITINLFGGISVLLFAAAIGAELIRRSMRPLSAIERTASSIADGDLSQRVPDPEPENPRPVTEVGSLARSLNTMLAQIESAFTAQAASEAAARSSEERMRRFIADASHELRTPLTTIRGFAELYRQGAVTTPEQTADVVRRIESEASRMGLLVEDLLLLARLDRERPLKLAPVELRVLASEAVEAARVVAADRDISLVTAPGAGSLVVSGDDARLRQVIGNLVSNALTHTPAGTPVTVRLAKDVREDGADAVIEVLDRGPGLSPEQQDRVFERFYRADPARTRRSDGTVSTGLGLAIVAALVAAHNGTVEVESEPGVGATFRVRLPLDGTAEEADEHDETDEYAETPQDAQ